MRRKYSSPVWIDTPLELHQQLINLAPTTKIKVVYGSYTKCFFRTVDNSILLQLQKEFPLTAILKANRPYTSVAQLRAVLEEHMAEVIRWERIHARQFVGERSITEARNTLAIFQNKGLEIHIRYFARNRIIILSEYSIILPGSAKAWQPVDNLTNNSALLYLKLEFLKKHLERDTKMTLGYLTSVDEILSEMQDAFGSNLFGKIHALQKVINSES